MKKTEKKRNPKKDTGEFDQIADRWQYIMLAAAIFIAVIFCCYYIISQSRWGFYLSPTGKAEAKNNVANKCNGQMEKKEGMDEDGAKAEEIGTDAVTAYKKRAYLTFDDGPSGNTGEILDILDKNNVKATFFVIGRDESYYNTYRDIVKRGHTLGLHSYTHDYNKIYASLKDFAEDIEELQNLLYDVTGVKSVYYRFPGGSSNTVSKVDMDILISYIDSKGLVYYDWNALNNDAVCGSYTPEQLVENIMADVPGHNDVVILMHDIDARHSTVESLQMLIDRLRAEGYELLSIDENAPLVRHR